MKKIIVALVILLGSAQNASAQVWDCLVDFSNKFAMGNFHDQARTHFAIETRLNPTTDKLETCSEPARDERNRPIQSFAKDDWEKCWAYRQRCSFTKFYVNAWPWGGNNHFHMFFKTPVLQNPLCRCDPKDGFSSGFGFSTAQGGDPSNCLHKDDPTLECPKWGDMARKSIYPHTGGMWIYLYVEKGGDNKQHVFTLSDITIGAVAAELWFVKTDGSTWGWHQLDPGYHKLDAKDVLSVWISTTKDDGGPVEIEDLVIFPQESSN